MLLLASKLKFYQQDKNILSWVFNVATANDMIKLGTAFAQVIGTAGKKSFRSKGIRIGLCGKPAMGKSAFVQGILSTIPIEQTIEELDYGQGVWRMQSEVWLRHYDAALNLRHICPASYWFNDTSKYEPKLIDIVEHANADRHNQLFDCLLLIEKANELEKNRNVTVIPMKKLAKSVRFQNFLSEAQQYILTS